MRADKRSFSFTWMRGGQKDNANANVENHGVDNPEIQTHTEFTNASWFMTNSSASSASSSGISSMSGSSSQSSINHGENELNDTGLGESYAAQNDSKSRLRRLGHSFIRFGTKYSIIEDEEENQPLNSIATPKLASPISKPKIEAQSAKTNEEPVHFDEDGNFIGRKGVKSAIRRKSQARTASASKEAGPSNASSLGRKLNKTVKDVKASFGNLSQKFRRSTRRRYRMGRGTPLAEVTPTRKILGRTPTKLYSPFEIGFETPAGKTPKRLERPSTPRLTRRSLAAGLVYSPANTFGKDLAEARQGMEDFHILSRDITRRSVRF